VIIPQSAPTAQRAFPAARHKNEDKKKEADLINPKKG
jgi:hypothetical protein